MRIEFQVVLYLKRPSYPQLNRCIYGAWPRLLTPGLVCTHLQQLDTDDGDFAASRRPASSVTLRELGDRDHGCRPLLSRCSDNSRLSPGSELSSETVGGTRPAGQIVTAAPAWGGPTAATLRSPRRVGGEPCTLRASVQHRARRPRASPLASRPRGGGHPRTGTGGAAARPVDPTSGAPRSSTSWSCPARRLRGVPRGGYRRRGLAYAWLRDLSAILLEPPAVELLRVTMTTAQAEPAMTT